MKAIDESIQKWEDILSGVIPLSRGYRLCALCFEHYDGMPDANCPRCPLSKVNAHCLHNLEGPWKRFSNLMFKCYNIHDTLTMENVLRLKERQGLEAAAQRMLDALHKAKEWEEAQNK